MIEIDEKEATVPEPAQSDEMLTVDEVEQQYGVKRATLYRYVKKGELATYRRGMDRQTYVRRADVERLRRFRPEPPPKGLNPAAIERAIQFQREVFGDRLLTPPISEIIEESRRERSAEVL